MTLVLVTADHEMGGFDFNFSETSLREPRELEGDAFAHPPLLSDFAPPNVLHRIYAQQWSFFEMFREFEGLDFDEQTLERLKAIVNEALRFKISTADAVSILARESRFQYRAGHRLLGNSTVPSIDSFSHFHVYGNDARMDLLGRKRAAHRNTVWVSGTPTSTPVMLIAHWPTAVTQRFTDLLHATDFG